MTIINRNALLALIGAGATLTTATTLAATPPQHLKRTVGPLSFDAPPAWSATSPFTRNSPRPRT